MKLGAERKKLAVLGVLLVIAVIAYFISSSSSGDPGYSPPSTRSGNGTTPVKGPGVPPPSDASAASKRSARTEEREFRPSVRPKRGEVRVDPTTIDPALRLDLLAKLQQVNVEGVHRSIFDFGQAPPPEAPKPLVAGVKGPKAPNPLTPPAPPAATPAAAAAPEAPKAPPVPLKFFGYTSPSNQPGKRAFFMEGEDVHIVREGEIVKSRYKIVRIGVNSVIVEDMQFKSQQTLPLEEQTS